MGMSFTMIGMANKEREANPAFSMEGSFLVINNTRDVKVMIPQKDNINNRHSIVEEFRE